MIQFSSDDLGLQRLVARLSQRQNRLPPFWVEWLSLQGLTWAMNVKRNLKIHLSSGTCQFPPFLSAKGLKFTIYAKFCLKKIVWMTNLMLFLMACFFHHASCFHIICQLNNELNLSVGNGWLWIVSCMVCSLFHAPWKSVPKYAQAKVQSRRRIYLLSVYALALCPPLHLPMSECRPNCRPSIPP